jgi:progesterone-induced-blocking factor 1
MLHLSRVKEQHTHEVQTALAKTKEVMDKIRTKQAFLEAEVPSLKRKLQDSKLVFADLAISDLRFQELRRTPESTLSLKDYVCMKTHEVVQQFKRQSEDARKQAEQAREMLASTAENLDASSRDSSHKERLLGQRAQALQRDLEQSEAARVELERKLEQSVRDVDELRTKGAQYDSTNARRAELEVEHVALRERLDKQAAALESLAEARDNAQAEYRRTLQSNEVLKVDKDYLARERDGLRATLTKAEREHDRLHDRVNELQRAKEEYHNQLLESRQDHKSKYEERLTAEVLKLQEASSKDLELIRSNGHEVWERENRTLREAREAALAEVERFHTKVASMTVSHDELVLKQAQTTSQYEATIAELRNQIKMKHFENAQLTLSYEEKVSSLRQLQLESEMHLKQLKEVKQSYNELESKAAMDCNKLHAQLEMEREKVATYTQLEIDLDTAIVQAASTRGNGALADGDRSGTATQAALDDAMGAVPVSGPSLPIICFHASARAPRELDMRACVSRFHSRLLDWL